MRKLYYYFGIKEKFVYRVFYYICFFLFLTGASIDNLSYSQSYIAQKGDTIIDYIQKQQLPKNESTALKKLFLNKEYAHLLKDGKKITFYYKAGNVENPIFNMLTIEISSKKILEIYKQNDRFIAQISSPFTKSIAKITIPINSKDLKTLLLSNGVSDDENLLINTLNEKISLKESFKKGGKISLILEKYTNRDKSITEYGDVFFASLEHRGRVVDVYRYNCPYDKINKFYYSNGQSGHYSELIKPVPDAKINSKFGYRIHPVSKVRKMHNGVDFGAPRGTPIYSASSGVIKFAGWLGGYGHHIKIDHGKNIQTEYGHLSKFAHNIKSGEKVSKGQVLGYVGSSGRATGAHLHFSVLVKNRYVDPLLFKIATKSILTKNHYKSFIKYKEMINSLSQKLDKNTEVAFNATRINNFY